MPGATTTTHGARRLPRAQRREQIVRAAASVFLSGGYDKTSMEDIARAAGVTRLIVYRIFESKEALYLAVLDAVLADLATSFDTDGSPPGPDRPISIAAALLQVGRRHPDGFRLLWRHTSNQPAFSALFLLFKATATDYAIALIATDMPDPTLHQWAAAAAVSHLYESICLWLDGGDPSRDAEFVRMLTAGVRAMVATWVTAI